MALNKYKLGNLIEEIDYRNEKKLFTDNHVKGISIQKKLISTKADLTGVNLKNYKILPHECFTYSVVTSRNGNKISIAFNEDEDCLVSPINPVFRVIHTNILDPYFLMIFFKRNEFDRYARFNSWGSAREIFSLQDMSNIDIDLPNIEIQRKYVNIYKSLQKNLEIYQSKVDDLKLVCDGYVEKLRKEEYCEEIGNYITNIDIRNTDKRITNVKGISVYKKFRDPTSKVNKKELGSYKIVAPRQIGYVQTTHNEKVFAYAFNNTNEDIVISSVNEVFKCNENKLLPEFLSIFFSRKEFDRYARYHSWGSAREVFPWEELIKVKIPIPELSVQKNIVKIHNTYIKRQEIAEKLKNKINEICPILIRGAIKEGE